MNQPERRGALNDFADEVAERVTESDVGPWVVFGPEGARDVADAEPPPDDLSDPVWGRGVGWMEKADAPIGKSDGGRVAMYAPDDMDELDIDQ